MDKRFLTPEEVANATINASIKKASLDTTSCIWLGILAGPKAPSTDGRN